MNNICIICGEGKITNRCDSILTKYKGHKELLPHHYVECDTCTSEYTGQIENKLNREIVKNFQSKIDNLTNNLST